MTKLPTRLLAPAMMLLMLMTACAEPTASALTYPERALTAQAPRNAPLVTGGGQLVGEDWTETYGITARSDADGNVSGQVEMHIVGLPALHGNVTCLAVDGTSAWIGGMIQESQDEAIVPVGTQFWFRVQDNGPGQNPVDRFSSIRLGLPAAVCNERRAAQVPWLLERGNVIVR